MNADVIKARIDAGISNYAGEPFSVKLDHETQLRNIATIIDEYRRLGWTLEYASNPTRLIVS